MLKGRPNSPSVALLKKPKALHHKNGQTNVHKLNVLLPNFPTKSISQQPSKSVIRPIRTELTIIFIVNQINNLKWRPVRPLDSIGKTSRQALPRKAPLRRSATDSNCTDLPGCHLSLGFHLVFSRRKPTPALPTLLISATKRIMSSSRNTSAKPRLPLHVQIEWLLKTPWLVGISLTCTP